MNNSTYAFFILLLLSLCYSASAQFKEAKFSRIGVKDGLSQGSVFSICQDYQGFMWIGTHDGLNKYDALEFTIYRNSPSDKSSLSDNYVTALLEDSKQRLWVGTSLGINLYNRSEDNFELFPLINIQSGSADSEPLIYTITEDKKGQIWFGSSRGLYRLSQGNQPVLELLFDVGMFSDIGVTLASNNVQSIFEDSAGVLWLGTTGGVLGFLESTEGNQLILKYNLNSENGLNCRDVRVIQEIKKDVFWIGTKTGGINVYNKKDNSFTYITHSENSKHPTLVSNDVRSLLKDRLGGVWIGTMDGLSYYTEETGFINFNTIDHDNYSLSHNSIRPIFQDKRGSVWFGTFYGGVNVFDRDLPNFQNYSHNEYSNSLSYNVVSGIVVDNHQNLWIGTEGGGLDYFNPQTEYFKNYRKQKDNPSSLSHDNVKSVYLDQDSNLWIGTYTGGLNLLKKDSNKFKHYMYNPSNPNSLSNNSVYAIDENKMGDLYIGTYGGGLNVKKKDKDDYFEIYSVNKTGKYHLSSNFVRTVFIDSKNNTWVGTQDGLNLMRNGNDYFEVFRFSLDDEKSISGNIVITIFEDARSNIWLGTFKNGLNRFNPDDNSFSKYGESNGLPGNNIFGIVEDENSLLWLSTNQGICLFDPLKETIIKSYNNKDGLNSNEYSIGAYGKLNTGELIFGGPDGFTFFHPDSLSISNHVPYIAFTNFKLFNKTVSFGEGQVLKKPISMTESITLTYQQNVFTVGFSVLNYILPEKNQYAFRLEGLEKEWNYVNTPSATYTNLNAGTYMLLVKGSNNDGIWNEEPIKLIIKILPPPWKSWWAYSIYCVFILLGVYLIIRFTRIRSHLEHKLQLEHLERKRQNDINEIKFNFFTNISHEFRTPLTLMMTPIQRILLSSNLNEDIKDMVLGISNNANHLLQLVNQLLDFRKQESENVQLSVEECDFAAFIQEIVLYFKSHAEEKRINLEYIKPTRSLMLWFDAEEMKKVFSNLLSNSFKFTPPGGCVRLNINVENPSKKYPEGAITVNVWDNGKGIPVERLDSVFEWYYQLNNSVNVDNNPGTGIGLAISKSLVEFHGGELYVKSNLGKELPVFTCFTVKLPFGKANFSETQLKRKHIETDFVAHVEVPFSDSDYRRDVMSVKQLEGEHSVDTPIIVVVEDNVAVRNEIVQTLNKFYVIYEANHGIEGWELVQHYIPDVVITDVMMPECDGISLLKIIKEDLNTNHIPVLLLTALTSTANMVEGLSTGGDDYILKPFDIEVLQLKISNILRSRDRFRRKFIREYLLEPDKTEEVFSTKDFLQNALNIIEENLEEPQFNVNMLARELGMSRPVLYRKVKYLTDLSVIELINSYRMRKAAQLLSTGTLSVSEVAYRVGFNDPKYFGKSFKSYFGKSPSKYAALRISPLNLADFNKNMN